MEDGRLVYRSRMQVNGTGYRGGRSDVGKKQNEERGEGNKAGEL